MNKREVMLCSILLVLILSFVVYTCFITHSLTNGIIREDVIDTECNFIKRTICIGSSCREYTVDCHGDKMESVDPSVDSSLIFEGICG